MGSWFVFIELIVFFGLIIGFLAFERYGLWRDQKRREAEKAKDEDPSDTTSS